MISGYYIPKYLELHSKFYENHRFLFGSAKTKDTEYIRLCDERVPKNVNFYLYMSNIYIHVRV